MAKIKTTGPVPQTKTSSLRLLVLTPSQQSQTSPSPFPSFLKRLTGSPSPPDLSTFVGYTSHPALYLKTKYFETNVTVWCDELPSATQPDDSKGGKATASKDAAATSGDGDGPLEPQPVLEEWSEQMLSEPAKEVRDVIGGIILLLPFFLASASTQIDSQLTTWLPYLEAVTALRDAIEEESGRDVASVVVLQDMSASTSNDKDTKAGESLLEKAEEEYLTVHGVIGWDYILWNSAADTTTINPQADNHDLKSTHTNAFGEKTSIPRLLEVLENTDWTADPSSLTPNLNLSEGEDLDPNQVDFLVTDTSADINSSLRPNLRSNPSEMKEGLLESSNEFQREMLGIKMAMLDIREGRDDSGPSSLAGELDTTDLGLRTPAPAGPSLGGGISEIGRPSRLSRTVSTSAGIEGDEMQVDQLTGLMERVVAMREAAGELSGPEKEAFARREVAKIMREIG